MLIASLPSRVTVSLSSAAHCTGLPCILASNHFVADVEICSDKLWVHQQYLPSVEH